MKRLLTFLFCMTLTAAAAAEGVPVNEATPEQKSAATEAYVKGRTSFDARQFVDALAAFRESYGVVASPNTHLMMAHTLRELGRNAEAYIEFGSVAEEAKLAASADPKYNESVELALKEQKLLREKIGLVTVEVVGADQGATLSVEGRSIETSEWGEPIAVDPGKATFLLTTAGDPVVRELEVTAGGTHTLKIDATEPEPVPQPLPDEGIEWFSTLRIVSYAVAGAGILSFAAAGGLGGVALSKHNELQDACGDLPCPDRQDDIDSGRTFQTVSNVMLIVGGALVVGGVVLWFVAPEIEGESNVEAESDVEVGLRVNATSLTLMGRF